jgi:hypothetical protein
MRIRVPEEFVPVARFPAESGEWVAWVEESGRPVVVTRGGRAVAVLLGADDYFGGGEGAAVLATLAAEMQGGAKRLVELPRRKSTGGRARRPGKGSGPAKARRRAKR